VRVWSLFPARISPTIYQIIKLEDKTKDKTKDKAKAKAKPSICETTTTTHSNLSIIKHIHINYEQTNANK